MPKLPSVWRWRTVGLLAGKPLWLLSHIQWKHPKCFAAGEVCVLWWACSCCTGFNGLKPSFSHRKSASYLFSGSGMSPGDGRHVMWECRCPHTCLGLFFFSSILYLPLAFTAIIRTQHCNPPPNSLPSHVTSKQSGVPCQDKFSGVANRKIPPSLGKTSQKTRCSLTMWISSYKCKNVSEFSDVCMSLCVWVSVSGGHKSTKYGRQIPLPNPLVRPASLNLHTGRSFQSHCSHLSCPASSLSRC